MIRNLAIAAAWTTIAAGLTLLLRAIVIVGNPDHYRRPPWHDGLTPTPQTSKLPESLNYRQEQTDDRTFDTDPPLHDHLDGR